MKIRLTAALASLLSAHAQAAGLTAVTTCKNLSSQSSSEVNVEITRAIDYSTKKSSVGVKFNGSLQYDGHEYQMKDEFSAALPVGKDPIPQMSEKFEVKSGQYSISRNSLDVNLATDKMPLQQIMTVIKVPGNDFDIVFKMAHGRSVEMSQATLATIYLINHYNKKILKPDTANFSLECSEQIKDTN